MLRRYRAEIVLFLSVLVLCFLALRALSQDNKDAKPPALKPGDEVKPLELESARLGKLKAQLQRDDAQENVLQAQFQSLEAEKRALQTALDTLVKEITARVKKENGGVEIVYDPRTGEDGTFHVNTIPETKAPTKKP